MFEISASQYPMYVLDKNGLGQCNILCGSLIVPKKIPIDKLKEAANKMYERNDCFRSYFVEKNGTVYQDTKPYEEREFEVLHFNSKDELDKFGEVYGTIPLKLDIRSEGEGFPESKWRYPKVSNRFMYNEAIHNVKMFFTKIRMNMLNREKTSCELMLVDLPDASGAIIKMHHVVSDAWSMMLVANQFIKLLNGEEVETFDYSESAENQKKYFASERFNKDNEFMDKEAEKCPKRTWIWSNPYFSTSCKRKTYTLNSENTNAVNTYCKENNTTPFMLFLTAVSVYASHVLQKDKFYLGPAMLGRSTYKEKNTIGMFVKVAPMLIELDQNDSFIDLIRKNNKKSLSVYKHQNAYFRIMDGPSIMFDLTVSYQNATLEADPSVICTQYYCEYAPGDNQIFSIEDRTHEGQYKIYFDHNIKISDKEASEFIEEVLNIINKGIDNDSVKISEL